MPELVWKRFIDLEVGPVGYASTALAPLEERCRKEMSILVLPSANVVGRSTPSVLVVDECGSFQRTLSQVAISKVIQTD